VLKGFAAKCRWRQYCSRTCVFTWQHSSVLCRSDMLVWVLVLAWHVHTKITFDYAVM